MCADIVYRMHGAEEASDEAGVCRRQITYMAGVPCSMRAALRRGRVGALSGWSRHGARVPEVSSLLPARRIAAAADRRPSALRDDGASVGCDRRTAKVAWQSPYEQNAENEDA